MCQRSPNVFLASVLCTFLVLGNAPFIFCAAQETSPRPAVADRSPSIPVPRAEPVVPASAAKSIATQLNDAYVSVFEHVAPAVVVIDVQKRTLLDLDPDSPLYALPSPATPPPANVGKEKDKPGKDTRADPPTPAPPVRLRRPLTRSEGSGFVIQSGGFILTNHHVVAGAEKIIVRLKDGRQFPGRVVGADEKTDIAVVKIEAADLPVAELANSDNVRVGQIACAIGVPYNQDYSFTAGVVSAKNRNKLMSEEADEAYQDYLQTDASINPGNSGGPLVDLDGKVIGMNTLINGFNRGLGFAIPSNMLREVGDQLMRAGRVARSYLGVRIETLGAAGEPYGTAFKNVKRGVIVKMILAASPAYRSDLCAADIITEIDGVGVGTDREFQKQVVGKKVGSTVQLTVVRRNKTLKVPVLTAELPSAPTRVATEPGETEPGELDAPPPAAVPVATPPGSAPSKVDEGNTYGLQWQELTKDVATGLNLAPAATGVLVTAVQEGSVAERAGLAIKDVITAVDDRPIKDGAGLKEALKAGDPRRGIVCYVDRLGSRAFMVLKSE